ncbi:2-C-methyl-D-erythritol 4-phosphate cytidylyltransferase [Mongoliitalea daihaiensis]|uniref:2-C-methyl-D-erythritol 4-phosphate cytidylyltransferase n=1 Tax=Mongoliitalea daihaiensis TaxID=2782006 RepID=UPI001F20A091|nr:2-C-methyl-D-erythritol 4-phosphate cytidylyltransferase [Mongoliitalea daihaiensis]UJP65309.1 2-C-methyl-D-erythritol 4-phosphate cytidylyltransferase [Mongoliitalea daihaiensis]
MKKYALIVAGGSGTRMGSPIAKQYLPIGKKPVLMHTLEKFHEFDPEVSLRLVIPGSDFDYWRSLCQEYSFSIPHQLVAGGQTRFQSVRNGLQSISETAGLVAIHDGVRPFVEASVIHQSFQTAALTGSAIAVVELKDSIRKVEPLGASIFQNRSEFRLVQTPQTFRLDKIKEAFQTQESTAFTDDATVYEHQGWQVSLIPGNLENIKLTTQEDLMFAEFLLGKKSH